MRYTTLILLFGALQLSHADTANDDTTTLDDGCDCYTVSGPDPGYFQHHRFYDFRTPPPPAVEPRNENITAPIHRSLEGTTFARDWSVEGWHRPESKLYPVRVVNSYENVYLDHAPEGGKSNKQDQESELDPTVDDEDKEDADENGDGYAKRAAADHLNSTHLVFRTTRLETHASTAEVVTRTNNILHCSLRVRLRLYDAVEYDKLLTARDIDDDGEDEGDDYDDDEEDEAEDEDSDEEGDDENEEEDEEEEEEEEEYPRFSVPGAVAGVFTYFSSTSESDIEILTSDSTHTVHYANQPDYDPNTDSMIPEASNTTTLPTPWTEWGVHRLDWFPAMSRWYADGEMTVEKEYGVPRRGSLIVLNLWSDGGAWSGNMTGGSSVYMAIEWIEVVYNTTDSLVPGEPEEDLGGDDDEDEAGTSHRRPRPRPQRYPVSNSNTQHKDPTKKNKQTNCTRICRVDDVKAVGIPEAI